MKTGKKVAFGIAVFLIVYVISYVINSNVGGYWRNPESDGSHSVLGVELKTALLWQPRFGYHSKTKTDILGAFYMPLIWVDRMVFHQTKYLNQLDTWTNAGLTKFHPNSD